MKTAALITAGFFIVTTAIAAPAEYDAKTELSVAYRKELQGIYDLAELPVGGFSLNEFTSLELRHDGRCVYANFPVMDIGDGSTPKPKIATGEGRWQATEYRDRTYSGFIVAGTDSLVVKGSRVEQTVHLEIIHPSLSGQYITKWKKVAEVTVSPEIQRPPADGEERERRRRAETLRAVSVMEKLRVLRGNLRGGFVAFCKHDWRIDELQVIGDVHFLTADEAQVLGDHLADEQTWYGRTPDNILQGGHTFCITPDDFKIVLLGDELQFSIRIATSCWQVGARLGAQGLDLPNMRTFAAMRLERYFDSWFPGWRDTTRRNYNEWFRTSREYRKALRSEPNKSPEPTPTAVTPRANEGKAR